MPKKKKKKGKQQENITPNFMWKKPSNVDGKKSQGNFGQIHYNKLRLQWSISYPKPMFSTNWKNNNDQPQGKQ